MPQPEVRVAESTRTNATFAASIQALPGSGEMGRRGVSSCFVFVPSSLSCIRTPPTRARAASLMHFFAERGDRDSHEEPPTAVAHKSPCSSLSSWNGGQGEREREREEDGHMSRTWAGEQPQTASRRPFSFPSLCNATGDGVVMCRTRPSTSLARPNVDTHELRHGRHPHSARTRDLADLS